LQNVLLYHVLGARKSSLQLLYAGQASTLEGGIVTAKLRWPDVLINDSRVINADVSTPNGVIHTLDKVLLPAGLQMKTVGQVLAADGRFTTLLAALQATGLDAALAGPGPFTIFAPTDEAFARLPAGTVQSLLANPDALKTILLYHVVSGDLNTVELAEQRSVTTLQGSTARIKSAFGRTYVNNAFIQTGNIDAMNGIVHAISRVLMPPSK
jgi:transforming growth factor-beta-induced protein